jgi:plastocyanin
VSITVDNDGAAAYFVSEINGNENVTELNTNNSTWTLTVGTRYVLTVRGAGNHPFEIRNQAGEALLSQSVEGSFETAEGVDFISDGTQFEFTLTSDLVLEIDRYFCTIHSGMNGEIVVNQYAATALKQKKGIQFGFLF